MSYKQNTHSSFLVRHYHYLIGFTILIIYLILAIPSLRYCFFWDNIQQVSKEAHWFYDNNFSSFLRPNNLTNPEYASTGYHAPLMGIIVATLWKLFGLELWVAHLPALISLLILCINVALLLKQILPPISWGWAFAILLLEPTILSQFVIASPDFILLTAFVVVIRTILQKKNTWLTISLIFLCGCNIRGVFAAVIIFITHTSYNYSKDSSKGLLRTSISTLRPYLPSLLLLIAYYSYYFIQKGWFFTHQTSDGHYAQPHDLHRILTHTAEFGLRSLENGRFVLWGLLTYLTIKGLKKKNKKKNHDIQFLTHTFVGLTALYVLFIFISQMPFSARYFMPQYLIMSTLVIHKLFNSRDHRKVSNFIILPTILLAQLTGHLWVYPDKIAKSWDCTLAHTSYYSLRAQCYNYIDAHKIQYNQISSGFCLYGTRETVDLKKGNGSIGTEPNRPYFIYSNISNLDDVLVKELMDKAKWKVVKQFDKGFVKIWLMQQVAVAHKKNAPGT